LRQFRLNSYCSECPRFPSDTIVLFQFVPQAPSEQAIGIYDVLAAISQRFSTYCIHNYCLDHGAIGGWYPGNDEQAVQGRKLAARRLSGIRPEDIPVVRGSLVRAWVDWRQLRRWQIPESGLPTNTLVLYRQPTIWQLYRTYTLVGVATIILQALVIAGLLWQRALKRSATEALEKVGGHLIHADEEEPASASRNLFNKSFPPVTRT
jgi:hypothetical protein